MGRVVPCRTLLSVSATCNGTVNPWFAKPAASGDDMSTKNRTVCSDPGNLNFSYRLQAKSLLTGFRMSSRQSGHNRIFRVTVAVGTIIADRPPHKTVRARLRIRLPRGMSSGEACVRIGMQERGFWNPPVQDWNKALPAYLGALTAANQYVAP